jgi:hypothetical protein
VISEYADLLAGRLSFDRSLAQSVRREVEDHLREAAAAAGGTPEAERLAITRFGEPRAIAGQLAAVALAKRAREVGVAVVAVIVFAYFAMQARLAWYALTQWGLSAEARALSAVVASIDRYAFWLAVLVGAVAVAFAYRNQLRRFCGFCAVAAAALATSVVCDGILTTLRLREAAWSFDFLVPLLSMAIEVACAAALVFQLRTMARRMAASEALLSA